MQKRKKEDKTRKNQSDKQKLFVESYLQCWNATEAARRAGYKGNSHSLAVIGWENLRKLDIRKMIDARLAEFQLTADEVLARLSFMAQGDVSSFLDGDGDIDFTSSEAKANLYLLKKARVKRGTTKSGEPWVEREIELHDPQAALVHIGRHYKLFTDRTEIDDTGLTDEQRADRITKILDAARARAAGQIDNPANPSGTATPPDAIGGDNSASETPRGATEHPK